MKRFCLFFLLIFPTTAFAQNAELICLNQTIDSVNQIYRDKFFKEKQEWPVLKLLVVPLRFYKSVLSDQLAADCKFEPTCSVYGYHSLRTFGPILGIMATADRLMRCSDNASTAGGTLSHFNTNGKIIDYPEYCRTPVCPFSVR